MKIKTVHCARELLIRRVLLNAGESVLFKYKLDEKCQKTNLSNFAKNQSFLYLPTVVYRSDQLPLLTFHKNFCLVDMLE